jgi:hypothetical protein
MFLTYLLRELRRRMPQAIFIAAGLARRAQRTAVMRNGLLTVRDSVLARPTGA